MTKISIEDIRKGDKIKVSVEKLDRVDIREGVAHKRATSASTGLQWFTEKGLWLADNREDASIELLERPKSREQELWEEVRLDFQLKDFQSLPYYNPAVKLIHKLIAEENKTKGFSL